MSGNFPKDFLWGAATSAHQVEGGNLNDWSEWERHNAKRLAEEVKTRIAGELGVTEKAAEKLLPPEAYIPENYISGAAADHYHRFKEDFRNAESLGLNAIRFSIEWSRVEPMDGRFDAVQIAHYREVMRSLREHRLVPFITLWHWTLPLWLRDRGGVMSPKFSDYFARYAAYIAAEFGNSTNFWMTVNEPNTYAGQSYTLHGNWPPGIKGIFEMRRALKNLSMAHGKAYDAIRHVNPSAVIGPGIGTMLVEAARPANLLSWIVARFVSYVSNHYFLSLVKNKCDYIGVQYYFRLWIGALGKPRHGGENFSDMGWEIFPEGLYSVLKKMARYGKPLYITENGVADRADSKRAGFIVDHIASVRKALSDDIPVRGYFYWSLLDNFEWEKGFWPRFGLFAVDYKTQERRMCNSALQYKKAIEDSGQNY